MLLDPVHHDLRAVAHPAEVPVGLFDLGGRGVAELFGDRPD